MTDPLAAALHALQTISEVHDRPDLATAAGGAIGRLRAPALRIVVMGEYKKGKSSLVNALLDAPVCAVDDDVATAARLEVGFADPPAARWWRIESTADTTERVVDSTIDIGEAAHVSTLDRTTLVRAGLPRRLLRSGVILIDTPGVGGISSASAVVTASSLADAHVVLFVSDCSQELTAAELGALGDAVERGPAVVLVESKADITPHWRTIVEADRQHIANRGLDVPVVAVSSALRELALQSEDRELNEESGVSALLAMITRRFVPEHRQLARESALRTARRVYTLLHEPLRTELQLLEEPTDDGATAALELARRDLDEFKARAGTWQQRLNDGWTDLAAAVDHDLRERFRRLTRDAEEELDDVDPDEIWDEFEPELYRRVAEALDHNLTLLRDRADELALRLAEQLDSALPTGDDGVFADTFVAAGDESWGSATRKTPDEVSSGARVNQAFRAGYGGAMPIMVIGGMALGVLGLGAMVLPLAGVAGVVASRRAMRDERERRLQQRRQQAKVAIKKYTDDALLRAGNERKQQQRRVQRALRDYFTARVKELAGSHAAAIRGAESAVAATAEQRRQRLAAVRDELARVEAIAVKLQRDTALPEPTASAAPAPASAVAS
ncbi:MAG: dynamin family protein [Actinomycetota bacterium]